MSTAAINRQLRLAQRPTSAPVGPGELVIRNRWLSLDPASRGWMSAGRSHIAPVKLGDVMRGLASGVAVASRHPDYEPGDRVSGLFGWQDYADRFDEAEAALAAWLSRGWLVGREEIVDGLTEAPTALQRPFDSVNRSKLMVRISDEFAA